MKTYPEVISFFKGFCTATVLLGCIFFLALLLGCATTPHQPAKDVFPYQTYRP